ncbi:MAG: hypothetical protein SFW67_20780 [Myxococcaceae bacterium]|nr:hypothetical protein [Myxococcaceae bacterium]
MTRALVLGVVQLALAGCWTTDGLFEACVDAGRCVGPSGDGGALDAGGEDAGVDAGATDAGLVDAGVTDAGATDAGMTDAGAADAGVTDAGVTDAGSSDGGLAPWMISFTTYQSALSTLLTSSPASPTLRTGPPPVSNCCYGAVLEPAGDVLAFALPGGTNSKAYRFDATGAGSWAPLGMNETQNYPVTASALAPDAAIYVVSNTSPEVRFLQEDTTLGIELTVPDAGGFTNILATPRGFLLVPMPRAGLVQVPVLAYSGALLLSNPVPTSACSNPTATDSWTSATLLPSGNVLMLPNQGAAVLVASFPADGGVWLDCQSMNRPSDVVRGVLLPDGGVLGLPRVGPTLPFLTQEGVLSGNSITLPRSVTPTVFRGATWFGDGRVFPAPGDNPFLFLIPPRPGAMAAVIEDGGVAKLSRSRSEVVALPQGRVLITPDGTDGWILVESGRPGLPLEVLLSPWVNHR